MTPQLLSIVLARLSFLEDAAGSGTIDESADSLGIIQQTGNVPLPRDPGLMRRTAPMRAAGRGVLAGMAGTAVMTAAQTTYFRATGAEASTTPAEVAKRLIRGVLQREVSEDQTETLNTAMHWLYGTGWGTLYGLAARRPTLGLVFGTLVWSASLVELPAMQLSPPVWELPPSSVAPDLGFHLVYGAAVAATHRVLSKCPES